MRVELLNRTNYVVGAESVKRRLDLSPYSRLAQDNVLLNDKENLLPNGSEALDVLEELAHQPRNVAQNLQILFDQFLRVANYNRLPTTITSIQRSERLVNSQQKRIGSYHIQVLANVKGGLPLSAVDRFPGTQIWVNDSFVNVDPATFTRRYAELVRLADGTIRAQFFRRIHRTENEDDCTESDVSYLGFSTAELKRFPSDVYED